MRLRARHPQTHQGVCADAIATLENIPRQALDELALVSQQRADAAIKGGHFKKSLVPVYKEDGTLALDHEEFPRPQTTLEGLSVAEAGVRSDVPNFRSTRRARPWAASSVRSIPILRSSTSITPAIRRASSTAPPRCC